MSEAAGGEQPATSPEPKVVYVHMLCLDPDAIGDYPLPPGYRLRPYVEDELHSDRHLWVHLQQRSERLFPITMEEFGRYYNDATELLPGRMLFLETEAGVPIGTATAWWKEPWGERGDWGQLHWVCIVPEYRRRGLVKPLVSHVLRLILRERAERGAPMRVMLGTHTVRLPAVKAYLDLGFRPDAVELENPEVVEAWRLCAEALGDDRIKESVSA